MIRFALIMLGLKFLEWALDELGAYAYLRILYASNRSLGEDS